MGFRSRSSWGQAQVEASWSWVRCQFGRRLIFNLVVGSSPVLSCSGLIDLGIWLIGLRARERERWCSVVRELAMVRWQVGMGFTNYYCVKGRKFFQSTQKCFRVDHPFTFRVDQPFTSLQTPKMGENVFMKPFMSKQTDP